MPLPPWTRAECAVCGVDQLATRADPAPNDDPFVCDTCQAHECGYQDGLAFQAGRVAELEAAVKALLAVAVVEGDAPLELDMEHTAAVPAVQCLLCGEFGPVGGEPSHDTEFSTCPVPDARVALEKS